MSQEKKPPCYIPEFFISSSLEDWCWEGEKVFCPGVHRHEFNFCYCWLFVLSFVIAVEASCWVVGFVFESLLFQIGCKTRKFY